MTNQTTMPELLKKIENYVQLSDDRYSLGMINAAIEALSQQSEPVGCTDDDGKAWAYKREGGKFEPNIKLYAHPFASKDAARASTAHVAVDEREAFEREMQKKYGKEHFDKVESPFDGVCYSSQSMNGAWDGWQARAALSVPAQQVEAVQLDYFSIGALEKLRTALSHIGVAAPESLEELAATLEENVLALCRAATRRAIVRAAAQIGKDMP